MILGIPMDVTITDQDGASLGKHIWRSTAALMIVSCVCLVQAQSSASERAVQESVWIGRFDSAQGTSVPPPWQLIQVNRKVPATEYRLRLWDGVASVEAQANNSMALLARPATVDLAKTPILCWRWRIDSVVASADMKLKSGDDYAARIYVAFSLPPESMDLMTRLSLRAGRRLFGQALPDAAINYVWDNRYPVETALPNAYTDRVRMIVVQTGNAEGGRWISEQRDVAHDFATHFGASPPKISSIAIATDTDNTHTTAHAGFAEIRFVPRGVSCAPPERGHVSR
jgi:hypothetical protein